MDRSIEAIVEVNYPAEWAGAVDEAAATTAEQVPAFISDVMRPIVALKGDELPVSKFTDDGVFPVGTTKYEKRGIALDVPIWVPESCIQCNQCAFVCPHAAIRPYLATAEELVGKPESVVGKNAIGKEFAGHQYFMQVSPLDCTGCGNCVDVCPSKQKSLVMKNLETVAQEEIVKFEYLESKPEPKVDRKSVV